MSETGVLPRIKLPYPHPGQQAVRQQARRFNWLSAGRRWRKTTLVMSLMVEAALDGGTYIWGAPTYDQVRIGFNETKKAAGSAAEFNISRMTAHFPQAGGTIVYRSLDISDNVRGYTADGVAIDEAGDVKQDAWHEVLRPMLIDTGGWLWAVGTPKGRNWFFREHTNAYDRDDSMTWQIPTLGVRVEGGELIRDPHPMENPDIPFEEIQRLFSTLPRRVFKQEVLAHFIEGEGAVFRNIAANMKAPETTPQEHSKHKVVAGVDWARQHDFTAISVGCATCGYELDIDRFNRIEYAFQRDRVKLMCEKWNVNTLLVEENSIGTPNLEMLQREGLPVRGFQTTPSSKPPLMQNLALSLEKEEFDFISNPVWTAELEAYEQDISEHTGRARFSAPEGMHDDTVIARALMLRASGQVPMSLTSSEELEQPSRWSIGGNGRDTGGTWRKL